MSFLKIKNSIFKVLIELFVFDKKKRSHLKARFAKRHLKKYVDLAVKELCTAARSDIAEDLRGPKGIDIGADEEIIWQYWHQGRENAPELIKKCFESVEKFEGCKDFDRGIAGGRRVVVLSYETIKDYIKLPEIYYKLLETGKMKIAHFSDILRLYLLREYSGLWIDSTILLTDKIPKSVWAADFCVMQKNPMCDMQENRMACYFIRAKRGVLNILGILKALEYYWAENDFVLNYFMFEHISTMLYDMVPGLKAEWENMPYLCAEEAGKLQEILFDDFDKNVLESVKSKTSIHKLSYKILKDNTSGKSYYDWIIGENK